MEGLTMLLDTIRLSHIQGSIWAAIEQVVDDETHDLYSSNFLLRVIFPSLSNLAKSCCKRDSLWVVNF